MLANLIHEKADFAARPQPGDEAVARGRLINGKLEAEHAGRSAIVAAQHELERLIAGVLAKDDDLVSLENIGKPSRDRSRPRRWGHFRQSQRRIGKHRAPESLKHSGDFHLDVLAGEDERSGCPAFVGDLFEQRRVDIDANAEGEDSPLMWVSFACQFADDGF